MRQACDLLPNLFNIYCKTIHKNIKHLERVKVEGQYIHFMKYVDSLNSWVTNHNNISNTIASKYQSTERLESHQLLQAKYSRKGTSLFNMIKGYL